MKLFKFMALLIIIIPIFYGCDNTTTSVDQCATPVFTPAGGAFATAQTVTITSATDGAIIKYTTDGTDPVAASTTYTAPINVATTTTIKAMATLDGKDDSAIATATYTINTCATPVFTPAGGTYASAQNVTITSTTTGAVIRFTTNGAEPDSNSTIYTAAINVATSTTLKAKAFKASWGNSATATATYSIFESVSVAGGTFTMGSPTGTGDADEHPSHQVTLSAYYISKFEVKQSEWMDVMVDNPSASVGANKPVEMVNYYSVLVYCNKRSIAEGLTPVYTISGSTNPTTWGTIPTTNNTTWNAATCNWTANGYRLPTEAEWEYAAKGGASSQGYTYAGSNDVNAVAWYSVNATATHPVGEKLANELGLFDMSGNVQEWVWDWYDGSYYTATAVTNPTGPASPITTGANAYHHTIRGGSWDTTAYWNRVAFRNHGTPEKGDAKVINDRLGFRLVRTSI